jgi:hypothetical protein
MTTPAPDMLFRAQFKVDLGHPPTLNDDLNGLYRLREKLRLASPKLADWYLGGSSRDESFQYQAFDDNGPTTALMAVLREKQRKDKRVPVMRNVGVWNGFDDDDGASMGLIVSETEQPSQVRFDTSIREFLTLDHVVATTKAMIDIWNPLFVSVMPTFYPPVFKDRPGIGWMLYLPQVLTTQQVPEARALVPVVGANKKQHGTIIVSVTDKPFSDLNPEHVKVAHDIEIRLVDQDLLPRYVDL